MKNNNNLRRIALLVSTIGFSGFASAQSTNLDQIRVQTSTPKKMGETAFSYLVAWRQGSENTHRANGLTFINGSDQKKPTSATKAAYKIAGALNDAISYDSPKERGAKAVHTKGESEFLVTSKEGFNLTQTTFRDYSNQALSYNIPGKKFNSANIGLAIDLVYAVAVEYIDGFPPPTAPEKTIGGTVTVQIDDNAPIIINTEDKTTDEIEKELATALGTEATFSKTPIYPNFSPKRSRNYKAFDGAEVQLLKLSASSISIDIDDPNLGVLTKFAFPDVNKPTDVAGKVPYLFAALVFVVICFLIYIFFIKKTKEDEAG